MENNTGDKYYEYYQSKLKEITYKSINLVKYEIIDGNGDKDIVNESITKILYKNNFKRKTK